MDLNYITCPFCGQIIFNVSEDENVEIDRELIGKMKCSCDKAKEFQRKSEKSQCLMTKIDVLFDDGCETQNPMYKPLPPEILDDIHYIAEAVAFERIGDVSVVLPDGTKAKITYTTVERTKTIKTKLS